MPVDFGRSSYGTIDFELLNHTQSYDQIAFVLIKIKRKNETSREVQMIALFVLLSFHETFIGIVDMVTECG